MDWYSFLSVALIAYILGATPLDRGIASVLNTYCCICGRRSDAFTRSIANILKGCVVVSLAHIAGPEAAQIATFFVFAGHLLPHRQWAHGGNGMALLLGTMIALHPVLGLIALFSWLFAYFVYRFAALAAVTSACATTIANAYLGMGISSALLLLITVIVVWRHRHGLARLSKGTEDMVVWD